MKCESDGNSAGTSESGLLDVDNQYGGLHQQEKGHGLKTTDNLLLILHRQQDAILKN